MSITRAADARSQAVSPLLILSMPEACGVGHAGVSGERALRRFRFGRGHEGERLLRMVMARSPAPSALAPFHDTSATEGPFTSHSLWSTLLAQTRVGSYTHDPDHGTRR